MKILNPDISQLKMFLEHPSEEQRILLRKRYNEDEKKTSGYLEIVKEWLKQEPHLPDTYDDLALLNFLRHTKYSLERAKKKIDWYFTLRSLVPELFANRDVRRPELRRIFDVVVFSALPKLTPDGCRVTVVQSPRIDFDVTDSINFGKVFFMVADLRVILERGPSDIHIFDGSVIQIKNLPKVPIQTIKKFFLCVEEAYPVTINQIHIVNATPVFTFVLKWLSKFVKDKIIKKIIVHDSLESLYEFVPKEFLPEEFGGSVGSLEELANEWMLTLEEYREWFHEQESVRSDEDIRKRMKIYSSDDRFGLDGSFKQLDID